MKPVKRCLISKKHEELVFSFKKTFSVDFLDAGCADMMHLDKLTLLESKQVMEEDSFQNFQLHGHC